MPFIYKKNQKPNGGRVEIEGTLADSTEFTIGDAVKWHTDGTIIVWGAGGVGLGIISGFRKSSGTPVTDNGDGSDFTGTYTTPASNTVVAVIDVNIDSIYTVVADATLGTTTGSDLAGYNLDCVAGSNYIDESSSLTTTASFYSHGQDPDPNAATNSILVSIQESQLKI